MNKMTKLDNKRTWGPIPKYQRVLDYPNKNYGMISIAGPCSIENEAQVEKIATELGKLDVTFFRGGVFRAGTYPPETFGLNIDLLKMMAFYARKNRMKTIVEVIDIRTLDKIDKYADAFQVGARHMQDYALLKELSITGKTVTIKRNMGATLDEFLGAAEYLCKGICSPILIERGSSTFHNHVRWDLSISLIAAVKRLTNIPIIVDASHGTGRRDLVLPMTLAGIAAGADGFLVETHPKPEDSLSDSDQSFPLSEFDYLKEMARNVYCEVGLRQ